MSYQFLLGVLPLPVTPSALNIKTPSMNKTISLINEGEINIPKSPGLREISFEFLLPQIQKYPFANYQIGRYTASLMIPLINALKNTLLPFQFIVVRLSPAGKILYFTNIKCLIEDYEYDEDAEEHGLDVMCSITLKEYKEYGTKSVSLKEVNGQKVATKTTTRSTSGKETPTSVKTTKNDTIPNIAKKYTGDFNNADQVAIKNGIMGSPSSAKMVNDPTFGLKYVAPDLDITNKLSFNPLEYQSVKSVSSNGQISLDTIFADVSDLTIVPEKASSVVPSKASSALNNIPSGTNILIPVVHHLLTPTTWF